MIVLLAGLAGCQLTAEPLPLRPLPEEGQPIPYADLVRRARLQAAAANEAFYVNRWSDLEESAQGLEQIGRFLPKASEVPARHKDELATRAAELVKEATQLREAAKAKDPKAANESLQRINLKVRELRAED
jgi:hypothetical protein